MPELEESDSEVDDFFDITAESRTSNEVVIFEIPQTRWEIQEVKGLVKLASLEIGKIHEVSALDNGLKFHNNSFNYHNTCISI